MVSSSPPPASFHLALKSPSKERCEKETDIVWKKGWTSGAELNSADQTDRLRLREHKFCLRNSGLLPAALEKVLKIKRLLFM